MTGPDVRGGDPAPAALGGARFRCALCGGTARTPLVDGRDRQHGVPGRWRVSRCDGCGLAQLDPLPAPAAIGDLYPPDYYAHRASGGTFRRIRISATKRFVLRHRYGHPPGPGGVFARAAAALSSLFVSRKNLLPFRGQGRLLDVGCGVGSAIWRLRAYGWDVRGVEMDDAAARVGRAHGLDIHTGDLRSAELPAAGFDLVRLSHVLEHVPDPVGSLREVRRVLAPGGRLWMVVPDIASRNFERHGADWFPLELPRHLFHFSPATLAACCGAAGLRVVRLRHRSQAELHARTLEYARETRAAGAGRSPGGPPLHRRRGFKRGLALRTAWLDWIGRGDLMEVVCAPVDPDLDADPGGRPV